MIQHDINPLKQHLKGFKMGRTRFYTAIDRKTTKNGDEIFHFRKKKKNSRVCIIAYNFFAQQI